MEMSADVDNPRIVLEAFSAAVVRVLRELYGDGVRPLPYEELLAIQNQVFEVRALRGEIVEDFSLAPGELNAELSAAWGVEVARVTLEHSGIEAGSYFA